jgi:uncharacterized protein YbaP (TraB family)
MDKKEREEMLIRIQGETTNHIVIEIMGEDKAYDLFEEIQNKYSLYDNCVIETDEDETKPCAIIIEGKNFQEMKKLSQILSNDYKIKLKVIPVPVSDTIIDDDRKEETGGFQV